MKYEEFRRVFWEEGIDQEKVIDRLWALRLGDVAFGDCFKTEDELKRAIRDFREFLFQFLWGNHP